MCPQFVDFDADGYTDIVTATFEGTAFVVRGTAAGFMQPEHITDSQGRNIVLSLFYDMKANKYDNADRSPAGTTNAPDHCVSAMVVDWEGDGDLDLLLGAKEGRLYLQRNEGTPGAPAYTGVNELLQAGGADFMVPGGLTAPRLVDWDGDGARDLICGGFEGGVFFFRNEGRDGDYRFAAPETLIATGTIDHDDPRFPNNGCYADPVDYDGDGDLDLLVGGYAVWQPEAPKLTAKQEARLAELIVETEEASESFRKMVEAAMKGLDENDPDASNAAWEELIKTPEFRSAEERNQALWAERAELEPMAKRDAGIWLYRRK